jgi:CheY-like chemotaxis protein
MLVFARKQDFKPERIRIEGLVRGMAELIERSLGPTVAVDLQIASGLGEVEADPNQIEAALLNLVVNARDAMHGEGSLVIAARQDDVRRHDRLAPGPYICLSVTDVGEGMDAETLKRATEPFFTTKGVGKGTGLGLSMVHGVAEQSGGTLILKSRPGQGTCAEIWLPALPPSDAPEAVAAAAAPPVHPTRRLNVLVVDDDPLILMSTVDMLEDLGHQVVSASSGEKALEQLRVMPFDLMITDHAMPRMTGTQLVAEARATYPALPMVLASGYAELPDGTQVDVPRLSKPFSQAELAEAVAKATG